MSKASGKRATGRCAKRGRITRLQRHVALDHARHVHVGALAAPQAAHRRVGAAQQVAAATERETKHRASLTQRHTDRGTHVASQCRSATKREAWRAAVAASTGSASPGSNHAIRLWQYAVPATRAAYTHDDSSSAADSRKGRARERRGFFATILTAFLIRLTGDCGSDTNSGSAPFCGV